MTTFYKSVLRSLLVASLFLSASFSVVGDSFRSVVDEFDQYKLKTENEFQLFEEALAQAYQEYTSEIETVWGDKKFTDQHVWVQYSEDLSQRTLVDYSTNTVTVEFIDVQQDQVTQEVLVQRVNSTMNVTVGDAIASDPVLQRAARATDQNLNFETADGLMPMLPSSLESKNINSMAVAKALVAGDGVSTRYLPSSLRLTVVIELPEEYGMNKADRYWPSTTKYAEEWQLEPALVMAIIHTESSFNPMARSRIPAYGLMQIVPRTAGKDAAKAIYGKSKLLKAKYLFNPENNIRVGAAYLHVLNYRYLKGIHNPESRLYCAIAAYNTGTANVAKAFIEQKSIQKAYSRINQLEPSEVYDILATRLPYTETRNYLKKVVGRYLYYIN